jgi:glycosyltransferase involved in cell wall biosynthesis
MYHGSLAPHRGVEELLLAVQREELGDVHLAFMGFGSLVEWLRTERLDPRYEGRVHLLDAVPPDQLPLWLVDVDVAVAPIQASTLNHRLSSPNKVFEAIAAGTPVAGSDFPEFRRVILDPDFGPLGTVFEPSRPDDIARAVRSLLDLNEGERRALRARCRAAFEARWNWETESRRLLGVYDSLIAHEHPTRALVGEIA